VVEVEGGTLTALAGFDGHQGIALAVEPRVYAGIDDVLARAVERGEPPFVLVLDSLEDPQNVGTLLRSAEAAGVHGVIFPTHHQAPLTPAAIKASAGAVEHLLLCPVDDLPGAMSDLRVRGLRIAAAEADAPLTAAQADLRGPLAIVVGSEGQGLSPAVRRRADVAVRIPMRGAIGSLNASVAGSILLFAAVAQRDPAGLGDKPARPVGADAWPVRDEPATADGPAGKSAGPARGQSVVTPTSSEVPPGPPAERPSEPPSDEPKARSRASRKTAVATAVAGPSTDPAKPARRMRKKDAIDEGEPASAASLAVAKPRRTTRKAAPAADAAALTGKTAPPEPEQSAAKKPSGSRAAKRAAKKPAPTAAAITAAEPARRRTRTTTSAKPAPSVEPTTGDDDELLPGGPASR
jgi:23S rRNA (guanosine2251-2'-O)-methyltransferase